MNDNNNCKSLEKKPSFPTFIVKWSTSYEGKALALKREKKSLGKKPSPTQKPSRIFVMHLEGTKLTTNIFSLRSMIFEGGHYV